MPTPTTLLVGEHGDTFLRVPSFYEKVGGSNPFLHGSFAALRAIWQPTIMKPNYAGIAEHFNLLHELIFRLYEDAARFLRYCQDTLGVTPVCGGGGDDFSVIVLGRVDYKGGRVEYNKTQS